MPTTRIQISTDVDDIVRAIHQTMAVMDTSKTTPKDWTSQNGSITVRALGGRTPLRRARPHVPVVIHIIESQDKTPQGRLCICDARNRTLQLRSDADIPIAALTLSGAAQIALTIAGRTRQAMPTPLDIQATLEHLDARAKQARIATLTPNDDGQAQAMVVGDALIQDLRLIEFQVVFATNLQEPHATVARISCPGFASRTMPIRTSIDLSAVPGRINWMLANPPDPDGPLLA